MFKEHESYLEDNADKSDKSKENKHGHHLRGRSLTFRLFLLGYKYQLLSIISTAQNHICFEGRKIFDILSIFCDAFYNRKINIYCKEGRM